MRSRFLTVLLILGIAAFIYYNKSSFLEKQRTRNDLENRIENITGLDLNLKDLFKGMEDVNHNLTTLGEDKFKDLKKQLDQLTREEKESLLKLLEEKGEETPALFQDFVDNTIKGDKD